MQSRLTESERTDSHLHFAARVLVFATVNMMKQMCRVLANTQQTCFVVSIVHGPLVDACLYIYNCVVCFVLNVTSGNTNVLAVNWLLHKVPGYYLIAEQTGGQTLRSCPSYTVK